MFAWLDCCSPGDVRLGWRLTSTAGSPRMAHNAQKSTSGPPFLGQNVTTWLFLALGQILWGFALEKKRGNVGRFFALGGEGGGRARKQQWRRPLLTIGSLTITITIGPLLTIRSPLCSCSYTLAPTLLFLKSYIYCTEYSSLSINPATLKSEI